MLQKMFSIFDVKAKAFGVPFFAFNAALAQRSVAAAVRAGESTLAKFPEDFVLYEVGVFDDATGAVESVTPSAVCNLVSLREVVHAS